MMRDVFLYGPPASGKTTLGRWLSDRLGVAFVDLDELIVARAGKSIPEIFAQDGETYFRELEAEALRALPESPRRVVALGGGTLLREENRTFCEERGTVLCLEAPPAEELERRIAAQGRTRPLGNRAEERAAHYASFPRRIADFFEVGPSLVVVGNGLAEMVLGDVPYVADETVARLYGERLTGNLPIGIVPSGEEHKTPQTVAALWHAFAKRGLGRRDVVAALGGGVTGDLVGFAAATWMRGMGWINVPTTLLSMVDASTGGKTGCDLPEGKNLAGAFHPPRLVVVDTDFLETLSPALLAAGRAEMIKHDIISGRKTPGLDAVSIAGNLRVKADIVRKDPFEKSGLRLLLNCGHTVAHAVEKLSGYQVSHGEAVAIGCVAEAQMAEQRGLAVKGWSEDVAYAFEAAALPTKLPAGMTLEMLRPVMIGDKKRAGSVVTFALPCGWGDVRAVPIDLGVPL